MGPALNIISPCALSLRLSLSRQREERSRGAESLFPLSSPLSKTTGSGSGFLEMSAFVCCVTAAALGRSSSDEVMHRLDEEAEWERREVREESSLGMDLYFNLLIYPGKDFSLRVCTLFFNTRLHTDAMAQIHTSLELACVTSWWLLVSTTRAYVYYVLWWRGPHIWVRRNHYYCNKLHSRGEIWHVATLMMENGQLLNTKPTHLEYLQQIFLTSVFRKVAVAVTDIMRVSREM